MDNKTAILIFTRSAKAEAQHKWSDSTLSTRNSRRIAQTLITHTRRVAKATGLSVIEVASRQQRGASFGQRLQHAIDGIWEQGFERVLVLGTDTPQLSTKALLCAAEQITPEQSVLGAATDGGAYLIGLHRQQFQRAAFVALPWQQNTLYQALSEQLSQNAQCLHTLPTLADIDNWEDLRHYVQAAPMSLLQLRLRYCYVLPKAPASTRLPLSKPWNKNFTTPTYNRPPPISALLRA